MIYLFTVGFVPDLTSLTADSRRSGEAVCFKSSNSPGNQTLIAADKAELRHRTKEHWADDWNKEGTGRKTHKPTKESTGSVLHKVANM